MGSVFTLEIRDYRITIRGGVNEKSERIAIQLHMLTTRSFVIARILLRQWSSYLGQSVAMGVGSTGSTTVCRLMYISYRNSTPTYHSREDIAALVVFYNRLGTSTPKWEEPDLVLLIAFNIPREFRETREIFFFFNRVSAITITILEMAP